MIWCGRRLYIIKHKNEDAPRFLAALLLLLMAPLRKRGRGAVAVRVCVCAHIL